jgi:D-glycero-beta-D-manno-heptose-7-phosphate kinase
MKILIIGDSCTDRFIYGNVGRLSPEAPVPVITPVETIENPGMAGNTMANCLAIAPDANIELWTQSEQITKTRFVEKKSNHMFIRYDEGEEQISAFDKDLTYLEGYDLVIVSDYNKGFLSNKDIFDIGIRAPLSIIDSKRPLTDKMMANYTFIKLNESERINNNKLEHPGIITTLGAKGAEYQDKLFPSPRPQETIDVSGAGDTFVAAFAIEYVNSKDVEHSIKYANEMSAKVVQKRGVVTPSETY